MDMTAKLMLLTVCLASAKLSSRRAANDESIDEPAQPKAESNRPFWSRDGPAFPRFQLQTIADGLVNNIDWEADEQEIYMRVVKPTSKVLFLGGNIGAGCVLVDKLLTDRTQQLCVEPNPEIQELLESNRAKSSSKFQVVKGVITSSKEKIMIEVYKNDPKRLGSSTKVADGKISSGYEVQKVSLDSAQLQLRRSAKGAEAVFDTLLADCEGCLCAFLDEHPDMLDQVHTLAYEADGGNTQCYKDLEDTLRSNKFAYKGCTGNMFRAWTKLDDIVPDRSPEIAIDAECGNLELDRSTLLATLNNTGNTKAASKSYFASYLPQILPEPRPLQGKVVAHTYWHGAYGAMPALAVKSFLATQDPSLTQVIIWLDKETPTITQELELLLQSSRGRAEVRILGYHEETKGTPLEGKWDEIQKRSQKFSNGKRPAQRTISDLVRYVVLHKHGGLWFDSDVLFLRDMSSLLSYEWAYPWSKRGPGGLPENHTLNAALLRLFPGSAANNDMISRIAKEGIPFGLWGLTPLRDNKKHKDLLIVDAEMFDPLWKSDEFFNPEDSKALLGTDHDKGERHRWGWFFSDNEQLRSAGLRSISRSRSLGYHWHNHWDTSPRLGSAFRLYEDFFDCVLAAGGTCERMMAALKMQR